MAKLSIIPIFFYTSTHIAYVEFISVDALQIGGGITIDNALEWIEAGAEKVHHKANWSWRKILTDFVAIDLGYRNVLSVSKPDILASKTTKSIN